MNPWRPAYSLTKLLAQVNTTCPARSKASDGIIGDTAHAASVSDHNPDPDGVVHALDLTHDPIHGLDATKLGVALINSHDPRIAYLIVNRRIASSTISPWTWRPYNGTDPHTSHLHLSLAHTAAADDQRAWAITGAATPTPPPSTGELTVKTIDLRAATATHLITAPGVIPLQRLLGVTPDGQAGAHTKWALGEQQRTHGVAGDFIFGPATASALLAK